MLTAYPEVPGSQGPRVPAYYRQDPEPLVHAYWQMADMNEVDLSEDARLANEVAG